MKKTLAVRNQRGVALEQILIHGDLVSLSEEQRVQYTRALCKALGISLLFRPFDFLKFNGKVQLYANRSCTEQLRKLHKISIKITDRERVDGLYVVTARATMGKKEDESIGAINIKGLSGEALANAIMKAETKAKRRVTLSICGLGVLDEVEAKEISARESKMEAELAVEATETIIAETTERPEFEAEGLPPSVESRPPEDTPEPISEKEYRLQTVKGAKGKPVSTVSRKTLYSWLKFYDEAAAQGEKLPAQVQDDAFHIRALKTSEEFDQTNG